MRVSHRCGWPTCQRFTWFESMKYCRNTVLAVAFAMPLLAFGQAPASGPWYRSAFADYKPYQEIPAGDWRALNDKVRDTGGGSIAHDMAMPSSAAASASGATAPKVFPKAPMKGHMGHQMPGGMK